MAQHAANSVAAALLVGTKQPAFDERGEHILRHLSQAQRRLVEADPNALRSAIGGTRVRSETGVAIPTTPAPAPAPAPAAAAGVPDTPASTVEDVALLSGSPDVEALAKTMGEAKTDTHGLALAKVLAALKSDADGGLTEEEATHRLTKWGPNSLEADAQVPLWKLFLSQFINVVILLLAAACVVSFALGEIPEAVSILVIILLNACIATYTERSSGNALAALAAVAQPFTTAIRDGNTLRLPAAQLVPGDIVEVTLGDVIPADGRLIASADLKVDEMPLTGESIEVAKAPSSVETEAEAEPHGKGGAAGGEDEDELTHPNEVYSGCSVKSGSGRFVVIRTGMRTLVGSIAAQLKDGEGAAEKNFLGMEKPRLTPLQKQLHNLALVLASIALLGCFAIFGIGVGRGYRDPAHPGASTYLTMVLISVSLAVSAVPEGLPLVQTIVLARGVAEMKKERALVRHLPAVEVLGSVSRLCSDKTGTLTTGKMTMLKAWGYDEEGGVSTGGRTYNVTGRGQTPVGEFLVDNKVVHDPDAGLIDPHVSTMLLAALLNSSARLQVVVPPEKGAPAKTSSETRDLTPEETRNFEALFLSGALQLSVQGNSSEAPIVVAAAKAGLFAVDKEPCYPTAAEYLAAMKGGDAFRGPEVPFSSSRKMMATAVALQEAGTFGHVKLEDGSAAFMVLIKGAPNYILGKCSHYLSPGAEIKAWGPEGQRASLDAVEDLSAQALRVLAVAMRPIASMPYDPTDPACALTADEKLDLLLGGDGLVFCGLVASMDPERDGVPEAVATAKRAGVSVIMITGDFLTTAKAIGRNIGLISLKDDPDDVAVDCSVLRPYGPDEYLPAPDIDEITSRVVVFARAKPADKVVIVRSLQRQGHVTAMTGDGVNDSIALNEADLGIAMGSGTDVAKGASDLVLLNDDFTTIIGAIKRGRQIYNNIRLFVCLLLGTNFTQVITILVAVAVGLPSVFEPLPLLLMNIVIDSAIAMSMGAEPPADGVMDRPPRPKKAAFLQGRQWLIILHHAAYLSAAVLGAYTLGMYWGCGAVTIQAMEALGTTCHVYQPGSGEWKTIVDTVLADGVTVPCRAKAVGQGRAMAFITIAFAEMMRGFTVRTEGVCWKKTFSNKVLVRSEIFSLTLVMCVLLIPGLRDSVFGFEWCDYHHWLTALAFTVPVALADETWKGLVRMCDGARYAFRRVMSGFDDIETELRQMRHHLHTIEDKLDAAAHKPAHAPPRELESMRLMLADLGTSINRRLQTLTFEQSSVDLSRRIADASAAEARRKMGGRSRSGSFAAPPVPESHGIGHKLATAAKVLLHPRSHGSAAGHAGGAPALDPDLVASAGVRPLEVIAAEAVPAAAASSLAAPAASAAPLNPVARALLSVGTTVGKTTGSGLPTPIAAGIPRTGTSSPGSARSLEASRRVSVATAAAAAAGDATAAAGVTVAAAAAAPGLTSSTSNSALLAAAGISNPSRRDIQLERLVASRYGDAAATRISKTTSSSLTSGRAPIARSHTDGDLAVLAAAVAPIEGAGPEGSPVVATPASAADSANSATPSL